MEKEIIEISKDKLYLTTQLIKDLKRKATNEKFITKLNHHKQMIETLINGHLDSYINYLEKEIDK